MKNSLKGRGTRRALPLLLICLAGYNANAIAGLPIPKEANALEQQQTNTVRGAYGTQKVRSVTGAMGKLDAKEMADIPVPNIANKMQGKFAGVSITQANGEPNAGMAIRIRGAASINGGNAPLIVVDGFPITTNNGTGLEQISPEEIENITILKDAASASLYG